MECHSTFSGYVIQWLYQVYSCECSAFCAIRAIIDQSLATLVGHTHLSHVGHVWGLNIICIGVVLMQVVVECLLKMGERGSVCGW